MEQVAESRGDQCLYPNRGRHVLHEPHIAPRSITKGGLQESAIDLSWPMIWIPDLALHIYSGSNPDCCPRESKMQTVRGQTITLSTSDLGGGWRKWGGVWRMGKQSNP